MKLLHIFFVFTILTTVWAQDTAGIHCPDIAYLDTSATITCSTPCNFTNTIYKCPCGVAPQCPVSGCTNVPGYSARIVNKTQTELTIISVQPKHAGNWSCTDYGHVGAGVTWFCHLVVAKIPSVNITSDVDADSVNLGDRISLTVDIRDYHCSDAYSLTLQIGSATYIRDTGRKATIESLTENVPINVTQTHFGDVKLVFVCGNHQWNITPEGVNELQPTRTTLIDTSVISDSSGVLVLSIVVAGAVVIIIIITTGCCNRRCRKQVPASADTHTHDDLVVTVSQGIRKVAVVYPPSGDAVHQVEDNAVVGSRGSASGNDQQGPGLRVNPVYVPTTVGDRIVTTGTSTETGVMGGDNLHPETRGEYVALDTNAVQPSNIYEHLTTYEVIANM